MTPLKSFLVFATLSAALTAGGLWYFHQTREREVRTLRSQNHQLRLEIQQRARAVQPAPPTGAATDTARGSEVSAPAAPAPAPSYYREEGNATPQAALQTFAWATDKADVACVLRLLYLDSAARPKAEAFWAALPEKAKAQWKTVDEMAAAVLTHSFMRRPWPDAEILAAAKFEAISDGRVRLQMKGMPYNGTEFQQTGAGWKYVLTAAAVDAYIQQSRQNAAK